MRFLFISFGAFISITATFAAPNPLEERDALVRELDTLLKMNKVPEALGVAERVLSIERKLLGDAHSDPSCKSSCR